MSFSVISGNVIPAVTGGVFDFTEVRTSSDTLGVSPSYILRAYIVDVVTGFTYPENGSDWPLFTSFMPDSLNDASAVYDTTPVKDGRLMVGTVIQHYGLQIKLKAQDYNTGWAKLNNLASSLDSVLRYTQTVSGNDYLIQNITRNPVAYLGMDTEGKRRHVFTVNLLMTVKQLT